jgi:hypothetical protein
VTSRLSEVFIVMVSPGFRRPNIHSGLQLLWKARTAENGAQSIPIQTGMQPSERPGATCGMQAAFRSGEVPYVSELRDPTRVFR